VAAPLLAPPALLALLEAAVPPMLWAHLASDRERISLSAAEVKHNASFLSLVVAALGPAMAPPAARPELQRDVARLFACMLWRQLQAEESYMDTIRVGIHSLHLVACAGGAPAPWAAVAATHGAAAVVELGATPPPGVADNFTRTCWWRRRLSSAGF
jgi:hypothetical protein